MSTSSLPRVLLVSPLPPPYGGIARWTQTMVETPADQLGVEIDVIDIAHKTQRTDETPTVQRLASGAGQILRTGRALAAKVRKHDRPACIHVNSSGSFGLVRDIAVLLVARILGVRAVLHLRFGRAPDLLTTRCGETAMLRIAIRLASATVALDGPTHRAVAREVGSSRARLIPNFIHVERYEGSPTAREPRVLFLGSVAQSKGISELLEAWARMRPDGWTLDLVGPIAPHYDAIASAGSTPEGVVLHGPQEHTAAMSLMSRASVLVLPSHTEGFPNVVLEAMASGTPVVATAVGAIPDMLQDGAGRVVPARDVDRLTAALAEVCASEELRHSMAERAWKRVYEDYSSQAVFAQYRSVWLDH